MNVVKIFILCASVVGLSACETAYKRSDYSRVTVYQQPSGYVTVQRTYVNPYRYRQHRYYHYHTMTPYYYYPATYQTYRYYWYY